ncbi:MAG: hypothetical protein MUE50_10525 [Pirellulaceae bacterium]|nr:hypothetical protein [Pirellulaceae bacterium]
MKSFCFSARSPWRLRLVTLSQLNRALARVRLELAKHGFWDDSLASVHVFLVPVGYAYGWQWYGSSGEICIPAVSLSRLCDLIGRRYTSLADVLRHEHGHALADTHRGLFHCRQFSRVFGAAHCNRTAFQYDPGFHVSCYSATNASEDFAETFMLFVKHGGRLPTRFDTKAIRDKWEFIEQLGQAVRSGRRRWSDRDRAASGRLFSLMEQTAATG